jgi:DNA-3-methyladenine glycosylase I
MHSPAKMDVKGLPDYLAALSIAVFEPGLNWRVVESKWPGITDAFDRFDVRTVAAYSAADEDRLLADPRVIRNHKKIEAVIHNAREMLALEGEGGGFVRYLRSKGSYEELASDLKARFHFLGDTGVYHFLYTVGEPVPSWEDWMGTHSTGHPKEWAHHA